MEKTIIFSLVMFVLATGLIQWPGDGTEKKE
jgi:hypothetical protein